MSNPWVQLDLHGLSSTLWWVRFFFWSTMVDWVKKTSQLDPRAPPPTAKIYVYVPGNYPSTKGVLDAWPKGWRAHIIEQKEWLIYGFQKWYMYAMLCKELILIPWILQACLSYELCANDVQCDSYNAKVKYVMKRKGKSRVCFFKKCFPYM